MAHQTKQTGSAIVVALFVVALVAIAATAMLTRIQQDMRRTELLLNSNQAYLYAQGSIAWAIDQLINDLKSQQPNQIVDKIPIKSSKNTIENATVESTIYDAQGFFNINNLTDASNREGFARLIKTVAPKMNQDDIQKITLATITWITAGGSTSADDYYSKQNPPYRSPHRLMASLSELRLVQGMTSELFTQLAPYIIALPETTQININNAPAPILMSLSPTLTLASAKTIEMTRQEAPFATIQSFLKTDVVKNNPFPDNKITTISNYFLVKTQVSIGEQNTILYTLMRRELKNSQPIVTILWQSKGTL